MVKKEKRPAAFLIDKDGHLSKGPISFGRYAYKYSNSDSYVIPTEYKIIVTPGRLKIESCPTGCLEVKRAQSLCPMSATYSIGLSTLDSPKHATDRSWLPWKVKAEPGFLAVEDPKINERVDLEFHFDTKVEGEVYDPQKK